MNVNRRSLDSSQIFCQVFICAVIYAAKYHTSLDENQFLYIYVIQSAYNVLMYSTII
jgi:hypothetical protein